MFLGPVLLSAARYFSVWWISVVWKGGGGEEGGQGAIHISCQQNIWIFGSLPVNETYRHVPPAPLSTGEFINILMVLKRCTGKILKLPHSRARCQILQQHIFLFFFVPTLIAVAIATSWERKCTHYYILIHSFSWEYSLASIFVFQGLYQSNCFLSSMPKKIKNNNANYMMAMGDECQSLFSGKGEGPKRRTDEIWERDDRRCDRFLMAFRLENEGRWHFFNCVVLNFEALIVVENLIVIFAKFPSLSSPGQNHSSLKIRK